ncbi:MAG: TIGR04282 family arsenosugar biosynthesis glycosyltransferase [Calothrix sp. C42_A2020_038]|nr:TIGR04282 family arsenosugar biosynthesis glycosyltransferase [Calothrix sp. C42_A2020_038]
MHHLILFTRYPEPNRTKTRLIPALGAEGAANLQREMTEHTLSQALPLQPLGTTVEVRFAGGTNELIQAWLGSNLIYQPQGEGDLGEKMARAFHESFQAGAKTQTQTQTIIIGTDCPGIDTQLLQTAFAHLDTVDLVLGPALDGGYYLIGLRCFIPELFKNIDWGTSQVLQQTIDTAQSLSLSIAYLAPLADVDRPEDLEVWKTSLLDQRKKKEGYSIF